MKILIKKISDITSNEKLHAISIFNLKNKSNETICGRVLLLELTNANDEITYNENGKPYFKNSNTYFSISHSGDYVICAISKNEIGIDIQKVKDMPKSKLIFSDKELKLSNLELVKLWSIKESIIKAKGLNMQHMKSININNYNVETKIFDNNYVISICEIT